MKNIKNLEWDDLDMHCAVMRLPRDKDRAGELPLFDTRSEDELRDRVQRTLGLMNFQCFAAEASKIEKIVGEKPSPVWRAIITYRYDPNCKCRTRVKNPSG